jgi:methionine-rich copper-binding protein CopC
MRAVISALFFAIVGGLLFVGTAYAHAAYLRSIPSVDAVIAASPARVEIWFKQELYRRKGENVILVAGPDGQEVSRGETIIDDDDRTHAWVELRPELPPGTYSVNWKNLSLEDGHPAEGTFAFTVDPQAHVTSTPIGETPTVALPTATESASVPSPTAELPVKSNPSSPCAAGAMPLLALAGLLLYQSHKHP